MTNFVSEGKSIGVKVKPSVRQIYAGDAVKIGSLFGVAATSVLKSDPRYPFGIDPDEEREFELYVQGVFELKCDSSQFITGDKVYFDPVANLVTSTKPDPTKPDTSTFLVGVATENIKRPDGKLRVRLNGVSL